MLWPKFFFILIYKITGIIQVFYIILIILFENFFLLIYLILYYFIFLKEAIYLFSKHCILKNFTLFIHPLTKNGYK